MNVVAYLLVLAAVMLGLSACEQQGQDNVPASNTTTAADSNSAPAAGGAAAGANRRTAGASAIDENFMVDALRGGLLEMEASRLAMVRSQDKEVVDFARRMTSDHSGVNQELQALAASKNVSLPKSPDPEGLAALDRLRARKGGAFDQEYGKLMLKGHKKAVSLFEQEAQSGGDAEVKAFAENKLSTLREHLNMAGGLPGAG